MTLPLTWFIIAFRIKKKKRPDLSPAFLSEAIFSNSSSYSYSLCSKNSGLLSVLWMWSRTFAFALLSSWKILPPKDLHGWFLLLSLWMCQLKCLLFKKAVSSCPAKAHQSLFILLSYFLYDTHYFLKFSYSLVLEHRLFPDTECQLHQSRQCLVLYSCPEGLVLHKISTNFLNRRALHVPSFVEQILWKRGRGVNFPKSLYTTLSSHSLQLVRRKSILLKFRLFMQWSGWVVKDL